MDNYVIIILDYESDDVGINECWGPYTDSTEASKVADNVCKVRKTPWGNHLVRGVDVHVCLLRMPNQVRIFPSNETRYK